MFWRKEQQKPKRPDATTVWVLGKVYGLLSALFLELRRIGVDIATLKQDVAATKVAAQAMAGTAAEVAGVVVGLKAALEAAQAGGLSPEDIAALAADLGAVNAAITDAQTALNGAISTPVEGGGGAPEAV